MNRLKLTAQTISVIAATLMSMPVLAEQPQTITISTKVVPQFVAGELVGCQLGFEVARNDPEYSRSELVYLTGNLGFHAFEGKELAVEFKLGTATVASGGRFTPPTDAYLIGDTYTTNVKDRIASIEGEEGFRLFLFSAGDVTLAAVLDNIIQDQKLTFAYAMRPGGLNAVVPVDLRVEKLDLNAPENSVTSDKTAQDWSECVRMTASAAEARIYSQMSDEELLREYARQCGKRVVPQMSIKELQELTADCGGRDTDTPDGPWNDY